MPTGYTVDIEKGISFKQFALNCARAFGALITMRDDALDVPIPDEFQSSDYHMKELEKAQGRLASLEVLSKSELAQAAQKEYVDALIKYNKQREENRKLEEKYRDMLRQVKSWLPPTPDHEGLKKFMVEQIESSIKFDCGYSPERPTLKTPEEWLRKQKESILWDIAYHTQENEKEIRRCKERTAWVVALKKSLED